MQQCQLYLSRVLLANPSNSALFQKDAGFFCIVDNQSFWNYAEILILEKPDWNSADSTLAHLWRLAGEIAPVKGCLAGRWVQLDGPSCLLSLQPLQIRAALHFVPSQVQLEGPLDVGHMGRGQGLEVVPTQMQLLEVRLVLKLLHIH